MNLAKRSRRALAALAALALAALAQQPAAAQEISSSHLAAARAAISAIRATEEFDMVLTQAAQALKGELIQKDPHLQSVIIEVVDTTAFSLAPRRADLEREAAMSYARVFTQEDLESIAAFYTSETGQKLLSEGPVVIREIYQAAEIWQHGIARDLAQQVGEELERRGTASGTAGQ